MIAQLAEKYGYEIETVNRNVARVRGGLLGETWQNVGRLLGAGDSNPKTKKNNVTTYGLSLTPEKIAGVGNLCPMARNCVRSCLNFQGQGSVPNVHRSRVAKTVAFQLARGWFLEKLNREIELRRKRHCGILGLRLNMFSDIPWEKLGVIANHPNCTFYDYTKRHNRAGWIADNYNVTFSYDGTNKTEALRVLESGNNVSIVFYDNLPGAKCGKAAHRQQLPKTWNGFTVIDGGKTDWRPGDPRGVIVGLRLLAKSYHSRNLAIESGFAQLVVNGTAIDEDSLAYAMGAV